MEGRKERRDGSMKDRRMARGRGNGKTKMTAMRGRDDWEKSRRWRAGTQEGKGGLMKSTEL